MIEDLLTSWDGELLSTRFDRETGAFFVIAVHSRRRGPAGGGTRAMTYPDLTAAVTDATRLAEAMSLKVAIAELPMGGSKSVIALPRPRAELDPATWQRILSLHAENLMAFNGNVVTGPDIGTGEADMDFLQAAGAIASGGSVAKGGTGSSAPATARGVYAALRRTAAEAGLGGLAGARIAVQGLGAVGMDLARRAAADGARLVVTDVDAARVAAAREFGADGVAPQEILGVESDIFAPCATGAVIDTEVARTLRTRVVVGAANNILATPAAGEQLAQRGILFAPDFVTNAGGVIDLVGRDVLGWTPAEVDARLAGIGDTLGEVFRIARTDGVTPEAAARRLAAARLTPSTASTATAPTADERQTPDRPPARARAVPAGVASPSC